MANEVRVGQTWQAAVGLNMAFVKFRIERIERAPNGDLRACWTNASKVQRSVNVSTLAEGKRAATLLLDEHGETPKRAPPPIDDRMREAHAANIAGETQAQISRRIGVPEHIVQRWVARVKKSLKAAAEATETAPSLGPVQPLRAVPLGPPPGRR